MLYFVTILVSLPLAICNTIIFFWILMAFRRTLLYLRQKKQDYKHDVMVRIFESFIFCLALTILIYSLEIGGRRNDANLDKRWKINCMQEKSYFFVFTLFTVCMMCVLRPTECSRDLSDIQELLDETLQTEMPTIEAAGEMSPEPNLNDAE